MGDGKRCYGFGQLAVVIALQAGASSGEKTRGWHFAPFSPTAAASGGEG